MGVTDAGAALRASRNTRDLGGYPTLDGKAVRSGVLLRSGSLYSADRADQTLLLEQYHLQLIIDLRTRVEVKQKPDPFIPGVQMEFCPVLDEETAGFTHEEKKCEKEQGQLGSFVRHAKSLDGKPELYIKRLYEGMVLKNQAMEQYGRFLKLAAAADPDQGAVLWHCSAGKDRAGIATVFLLMILGVPWEIVAQDYTKSNEFLMEETQARLEQVRAMGADEALLACVKALSQVREEYLIAAMDSIKNVFGSFDLYMRNQLGISKEIQETLRLKYLV